MSAFAIGCDLEPLYRALVLDVTKWKSSSKSYMFAGLLIEVISMCNLDDVFRCIKLTAVRPSDRSSEGQKDRAETSASEARDHTEALKNSQRIVS